MMLKECDGIVFQPYLLNLEKMIKREPPLPGVFTKEDIINTLEGALKLPIDFASFNIATPLPGSSIRQRAVKKGKLLFRQDGFDIYGRDDVLGNENVFSERIRQLR